MYSSSTTNASRLDEREGEPSNNSFALSSFSASSTPPISSPKSYLYTATLQPYPSFAASPIILNPYTLFPSPRSPPQPIPTIVPVAATQSPTGTPPPPSIPLTSLRFQHTFPFLSSFFLASNNLRLNPLFSLPFYTGGTQYVGPVVGFKPFAILSCFCLYCLPDLTFSIAVFPPVGLLVCIQVDYTIVSRSIRLPIHTTHPLNLLVYMHARLSRSK